MPKVKVTRLSHSRREEGRFKTYRKGDTFNASERELKMFKDRLERVGGAAAAKSAPKTEAKTDGDSKASAK